MKGRKIKFFTIFIILIFTLAPLGAMDLNQNKNIAQDNDNKNIDEMAVNDTNDTEIGTMDVNETTDDCNKENAAAGDFKENSTKVNKDLLDPNLRLEVPDSLEGDPFQFSVHLNETIWTGKVRITCDDLGFDDELQFFKGEIGSTVEYVTLTPGNYTVTAYYGGNDKFKSAKVSETFEVKAKNEVLINPNLTVKVTNVYGKGSPFIEVHSDAKEHLTVEYQIYNETSRLLVENMDIEDGYGAEKMNVYYEKPENYTVKVVYKGNEKYCACNTTTNFSVCPSVDQLVDLKVKPSVNVDMNDNTKKCNLDIGWEVDPRLSTDGFRITIYSDGNCKESTNARKCNIHYDIESENEYYVEITYNDPATSYNDSFRTKVNCNDMVNDMPVEWDVNVINGTTRNVTETFTALTPDGDSIIEQPEINYICNGTDKQHTFNYSYNYNGVDYCFTKTLTFD